VCYVIDGGTNPEDPVVAQFGHDLNLVDLLHQLDRNTDIVHSRMQGIVEQIRHAVREDLAIPGHRFRHETARPSRDQAHHRHKSPDTTPHQCTPAQCAATTAYPATTPRSTTSTTCRGHNRPDPHRPPADADETPKQDGPVHGGHTIHVSSRETLLKTLHGRIAAYTTE
jgi:hypothetical protein